MAVSQGNGRDQCHSPGRKNAEMVDSIVFPFNFPAWPRQNCIKWLTSVNDHKFNQAAAPTVAVVLNPCAVLAGAGQHGLQDAMDDRDLFIASFPTSERRIQSSSRHMEQRTGHTGVLHQADVNSLPSVRM